jgi:flagellar protein FliO/FliZ
MFVLNRPRQPERRRCGAEGLVDILDYLRFLGALAFVLGLLVGCAWLLRRYGHKLGALGIVTPQAARTRLGIVETIGLGPRQRLAIIRRDDVEHLLLLGPDGAHVVESGIRRDA